MGIPRSMDLMDDPYIVLPRIHGSRVCTHLCFCHVTSPNIVVLLLMFTGVTLARYTGIEPVIAASTGTIHGYVHALHG